MTRKFLGIAAIVLAIVFLMLTCNVPTGTAPDDTTAVDMTPEIIDGYWWIGGVNTGIPATGATGPEGGKGPAGVSPTIIDGFWWIGDVNTGVPATGAVGVTPEIIDGFWWIGGTNTGVSATGAAGATPEIIDGFWHIDGINTGIPVAGATPEIVDGYWWIGGVDTGVPAMGATGPAGNSPVIIDGFWWIGGVNTGVPATGAAGVAGSTPEIIEGYWWINGVNTNVPATGATGPAGNSPVIIDGYWWIGGVNTDVPATGAVGVPGATPEIIDGFWWVGGVNTGVPATLRPTASIMIVCNEGIPVTHLDLRIDQQYTLYARDPDGKELTNILWDSDHPNIVSVHRITPRFAIATGSSIQIRGANRDVVGQTAIITATSLEGGNTLIETFITVTVYCDGRDRENFIYYYDFGAIGDGKTCDLLAIYEAHREANRLNKPVRADYGATYRISGIARTVIIQTNTDWRDAHFLIDDRNLSDPMAWVFQVTSQHTINPLGNTVTSLTKGQANLGRTFEHPSLVMVENNTIKRYIRRGADQNSGSPQVEVFLVDINGNVCPTTPILWDYEKITASEIRPIDAEQLTITGGIFTTIANHSYPRGLYHARNILIERSNTVVDGFRHHAVDDYNASPYSGFTISDAANVTIQNSYFTGLRRSVHGTYDIKSYRTVNLVFKNVRQTNDINDTAFWGIFASNESKNITFDRVYLSRFDAHRGTHNATIKDSTIGHEGIQIIGSGLLTIENTTITGIISTGYSSFIYIRYDYGSTWDGEIVIRNSIFHPNGSSTAVIIGGSNDGTWNFGYQTFLPRKITIDGLKVIDSQLYQNNNALRIFAPFEQNPNAQFPIILTEEVHIRNLTRDSGYGFITSTNNWFNSVPIFKD